MDIREIPEGCIEDSQGRFVPKDKIKPEDLQKDELVRELIQKAKGLRENLAHLKATALGDVRAHVDLVAERYDVKLGGKKGNISLLSYDGKFRVQVAVAERLVFDEKITIAKSLVDECLTDWTQDGREEIKLLITDAFQVDKEGCLNTGRILSLRKLDIRDERWQRAMTAISDSLSVHSTATYIRFYERQESDGKWLPISLDLAVV
ncbi:MAG: DUF3164 family protein [Proteobacteria bacterium]|nr:DUF3164 family protein [Pseudomonadota bacterium]